MAKKKQPQAETPWYEGENRDALFYLLIAIFFVELIVGGVAFFYGIIHAAPETPGGPPVARFPWLVWALSAVLCPVALLLVVHLAGSFLAHGLRDGKTPPGSGQDEEKLPESMRRFYAAVRNAPTLVVLLGILLAGAALFFVDGAWKGLLQAFSALVPYLPWICVCGGGLLAVCFLAHAFFVYRQRKMEQEYAWRREVLEKTGIVLMDMRSRALPQNEEEAQRLLSREAIGHAVLDVTQALPESGAHDAGGPEATGPSETGETGETDTDAASAPDGAHENGSGIGRVEK